MQTKNPLNGFYGAIHGNKDEAWNDALKYIKLLCCNKLSKHIIIEIVDIREFLDSVNGRYFANVVNEAGGDFILALTTVWKSNSVMYKNQIKQELETLSIERFRI